MHPFFSLSDQIIKNSIRGVSALFLGAFLFLFTVSEALSSQQKSTEGIESHLIALENKLMQAVMDRDSVVMDKIIGEDFLLTSSESSSYLMPKTQYVRGSMMPEILQVDSFRFHDFKVRMFDKQSMAVVHCRIDWKSTYRGKPWNADFLMTDVWTKRDSNWKLISRHSSYPRNRVLLSESDTSSVAISEACSDSAFRAFDFWIGQWTVRNREGTVIGKSRVSRVSNGCAILEEWTDSRGTSGRSLNFFDSGKNQWRQTWVGGGGAITDYPGKFEDGVMTFYANRNTPKGTARLRMRFTPLPDGNVEQRIDLSTDNGKTWKPGFLGIYEPIDINTSM